MKGNLQKIFWGDAIAMPAITENRTPKKVLNHETPEEVWSENKPDVGNTRLVACEAMIHISKEKRPK